MKYLIWPLLIFLIIFRFFTTRPVYKTGDIVRISATIYSDPVVYPDSQYLRLGELKIYLPVFPEIAYGDSIVMEGVVVDDRLEKPKVISLKSGKFLFDFRNRIISFYRDNLPQPESGLIAGIVLGAKGTLDRDFYNQTKSTGVAHVVVASGTNVTFVVSFLMGVAVLFLSRRKAIVFVILGIILYLFISGFDAPLIRAAVMASLAFFAQETGRLTSAWRVLLITAGLMIAYNPDWVTDIGFTLSFASTASIMLFQKRIDVWIKKIPGVVRKDLSTTLSAQVGVSPILFVIFGQFNIWSPLINALILWTVPPLMILGGVGGTIGVVFPTLGKLILWLSYPMLWWFVRVVEAFG